MAGSMCLGAKLTIILRLSGFCDSYSQMSLGDVFIDRKGFRILGIASVDSSSSESDQKIPGVPFNTPTSCR